MTKRVRDDSGSSAQAEGERGKSGRGDERVFLSDVVEGGNRGEEGRDIICRETKGNQEREWRERGTERRRWRGERGSDVSYQFESDSPSFAETQTPKEDSTLSPSLSLLFLPTLFP